MTPRHDRTPGHHTEGPEGQLGQATEASLTAQDVVSRDTNTVDVHLIDVEEQSRVHFEPAALTELATSIEANGLAVPVLVRPVADRYVLVHGERRLRAMVSLGWKQVPAEVRVLTDEQARWLQLVENVNREDLNPVEEANAYRRELDGGLTQEQLAQRLGKSRSQIAQKVRLLDLPGSVLHLVAANRLTEGHTRQLLRFKAFYTDAHTVTVDTGEQRAACAKVADLLARDDDSAKMAGFNALRPLDWPHGYPILPEHPTDLAAMALHYRALAADVVPQWHAPATYYALVVARHGLPVSLLTTFVDNWYEQIESAVLCLATFDKSPDTFCHAGYKSDLRHAGLTDHDHIDVMDRLMDQDWMPLIPSACREHGPHHKRYLEYEAEELKRVAAEDAVSRDTAALLGGGRR